MRALVSVVTHEAGETLIELIITIAIMGVAMVALVGGVGSAAVMSDLHRRQAVEQDILRSYVEAVQGHSNWPGCFAATPASVQANYGPSAVGLTGYDVSYTATAVTVTFWDPSLNGGNGGFAASCPGGGTTDTGFQKITLQVSGARRTKETMDVIKRCTPARGSGCP